MTYYVEVEDLKYMLENEIKIAEAKIKPSGTGNIHTAIAYLKSRLEQIESAENNLNEVIRNG